MGSVKHAVFDWRGAELRMRSSPSMEADDNRDANESRPAPSSVVDSIFQGRVSRKRRIRTCAPSDEKDGDGRSPRRFRYRRGGWCPHSRERASQPWCRCIATARCLCSLHGVARRFMADAPWKPDSTVRMLNRGVRALRCLRNAQRAARPMPEDALGPNGGSSPAGGARHAPAMCEVPGGRSPRAIPVPAGRTRTSVLRVLHGRVVR